MKRGAAGSGACLSACELLAQEIGKFFNVVVRPLLLPERTVGAHDRAAVRTTRQMKYFVAIADCDSFTEAAERAFYEETLGIGREWIL